MTRSAEIDASVHLNLDALYEKVEATDSRYCFPFDTATTKATLLLLIRRVQVAEQNAERLSRQYDALVKDYEELDARFPTSAQAMLGRDFVDAVLADVFQGKRDHLREQMLSVVAKVSRRHPWPYFEECVEAEVQRRLTSVTPPGQDQP